MLQVEFLKPIASSFHSCFVNHSVPFLENSSFGILTSLWKHKMTFSLTFFHYFLRHYLGGDLVIVISSYYRHGKLLFSKVMGLAEV